jgi:mRNA (2'-O-methyladenosine-N6-)-methyltransferase
MSRPLGSVSLPSGLGAGGRGKEKAPCRYLHFEVDWDGGNGEVPRRDVPSTRRHKLEMGLGPYGKETALVRIANSTETPVTKQQSR